MALKDLVSDLSNFKYGITSPDKVDAQIETGVDFFDNNEGGADGFTPKTDLESLYHKVRDGNVVAGPIPPGNSPQFQSPFLDTPIANAVSLFNDDPFSVTLGTKPEPLRGDKRFNDRTYYIDGRQPGGYSGESPFLRNAHMVAQENTDINKTFDVTTMDDMVYGGYNLPGQNSSAGNTQINIAHNKRRGAYGLGFPISVFQHQPFPIAQQPNVSYLDRYFSEASGKSIHISPAGELKAGFRYGASHTSATIGAEEELIYFTQFTNFNPGNTLFDKAAAPWSSDVTLGDRLSVYNNYVESEGYPSKMVLGSDTILPKWPEVASTNPVNPTPYGLGNQIINAFDNDFDVDDMFEDKLSILKDSWDDKFEFSKGQFKNVPSGLNQFNKFGTKSYRSVANSGPFDGNDNHPLILREVGNRWGADQILGVDLPTEGFVADVNTLIGRSVQDKLRLAKWMFTTGAGLGFIVKQTVLQALNPTLETKIWNPISALSISGGSAIIDSLRNLNPFAFDPEEALSSLVDGAGSIVASTLLPIGRPDRHLGKSYGQVISDDENWIGGVKNNKWGRLAYQAVAFGGLSIEPGEAPEPDPTDPVGSFTNFINNQLERIESRAIDALGDVFGDSAEIAIKFTKSNPNRYSIYSLISSAPKSLGNNYLHPLNFSSGISFMGAQDLAVSDVGKALQPRVPTAADGIARGGTFNPASHVRDASTTPDIKTHFTLPYSRLNMENAYEGGVDEDAKLTSMITKLAGTDETSNYLEKIRNEYLEVSKKIGETTTGAALRGGSDNALEPLGVIKGGVSSPNVDRRNILPVLHGETKPTTLNSTGEDTSPYKDFIKFMFRDVVNNKWLVFRSILSDITDTVTPNFNEHKYIGRPDTLYTYGGITREIGFNMKTYPKTKQELPMLMEKMNYLVGLCYPSFTETERMVAPFVELTIGDMFVGAPGLLGNVTVTVEEATTWEIDEGLQFPHFISTAITFKHIGKYLPVTTGKHYDLSWHGGNEYDGSKPMGSWATPTAINPIRDAEYSAYDSLNLQNSTANEQAEISIPQQVANAANATADAVDAAAGTL